MTLFQLLTNSTFSISIFIEEIHSMLRTICGPFLGGQTYVDPFYVAVQQPATSFGCPFYPVDVEAQQWLLVCGKVTVIRLLRGSTILGSIYKPHHCTSLS